MSSRTSFLRSVARSFPALFGLILCLVGIPLVLAGLSAGKDERALRTEGVVSQGTVIDKRIERVIRPKKGGGTDVRTTYLIRYRFQANTGATIEGEQAANEKTWESLGQNGRVAVRYVASNPALNRMEGQPNSGEFTLVIIGGLVALAGTVGLILGMSRVRRTLSLLRDGLACDAKIVKMDARTVRGRTSYVIHYTYQDTAGETHNGRGLPMTDAEASGWKVGDVGRARVDPSRPALSVWVGEEEA